MQKKDLQVLRILRSAAHRQVTFVFFPHAGGSPLSVGALAAALPSTVGVVAVDLVRGGGRDGLPRRVGDAVELVMQDISQLARGHEDEPLRIVLVGNSYGALLAYEMVWPLVRAGLNVERLIVSGFRSPAVASAEAPLHRLAPRQLQAELAARFAALPSPITGDEDDPSLQALRADLEACDTYRHAHQERLAVPIDVLHLLEDPSVSVNDLLAWSALTIASTRVKRLNTGHFPWATHPSAVARILSTLTDVDPGPARALTGHAAMSHP